MKLTLLQCHPDPRRLASWATRFGLTAGGDDLGYALHTLLVSAFGESAPKPFRHFGDVRGLLAYTAHDPDALQLAAQMAAPDVHATLGLERFATRGFPTEWAPGRRLGFEVRVRPVLRTREGRERDVFQIAPKDEAAAARVFNLARQDVAGFDIYARRIARMFSDQPNVLEDILEGLFYIALADGRYHEGEESFLNTVAAVFGLSPQAFACIEARHLEGRGRDPWQVLGVPRDAEMATIRARWRELVRTHHPDKMIARGLPPETVNLANARLTAINRAWEEISARKAAASDA